MIAHRSARIALLLGTALAAALPAAAHAGDGVGPEWDARVEVNWIESDLNYDEGEGLDSSGFGGRADVGADFDLGKTTRLRVEGGASVFEYNDSDRGMRKSYGGVIELKQELGGDFSAEFQVRNIQNVAVLEASSADQTSGRVQLQWDHGDDRVTVYADYRERDYDTTTAGHGEGYRLYAQYRRHFGSYHWLYIEGRHEDMESKDETRRSHERQVVRAKYSLPVARRLRLRPSVEYRQWKYDARVARGDPNGDLRSDHYVAPGVEVAWGRDSRGFYLLAGGEYRFRHSNDSRYDEDAIRLGAKIGYRF